MVSKLMKTKTYDQVKNKVRSLRDGLQKGGDKHLNLADKEFKKLISKSRIIKSTTTTIDRSNSIKRWFKVKPSKALDH